VSIGIAQGSQLIGNSGGARKLLGVTQSVIGAAPQPASSSEVQLSVGIDLAAQNKNTAACVIEWRRGSATARAPLCGPAGEDLDWLVSVCGPANAIGIDAPFGWPEHAVQALVSWAAGEGWPDVSKDELRYRATDRIVREGTGISPLSVSSDRIAVTAWRCALLLDLLRTGEHAVDRAGRDGIFEVYPAAALTCWGLSRKGYKTAGDAAAKQRQRQARAALIGEISRRAPWLDLSAAKDACIDSDHALDALLASLVAHAGYIGRTVAPPADDDALRIVVSREGWIHLPDTSLEHLVA
jgi:predicted nuclease with RNAse H fold